MHFTTKVFLTRRLLCVPLLLFLFSFFLPCSCWNRWSGDDGKIEKKRGGEEGGGKRKLGLLLHDELILGGEDVARDEQTAKCFDADETNYHCQENKERALTYQSGEEKKQRRPWCVAFVEAKQMESVNGEYVISLNLRS